MKTTRHGLLLLFCLCLGSCSNDKPSPAGSDGGVVKKTDAAANANGEADAHSDSGPAVMADASPDDAGRRIPGPLDSGVDSGGELDAETPPLDLSQLRSALYPNAPFPAENAHTDAKEMLGKILFWDEQLSSDDTVACGTCHRPAAGGADPRSTLAFAHLPGPDGKVGTGDDVQGSPGVVRCDSTGMHTGASVQVTGRRAPSYLDAMFQSRLFWDGRAECTDANCPSASAFEDPDNPGVFPIKSGGALEIQSVGPPLNDVEMACESRTWDEIHKKLQGASPLGLSPSVPKALSDFIQLHNGSYPELFAAAFGDEQTSGPLDEINTRRIAFAIATHERALRSNQTPFDAFNAGDDEALTPAQLRGLAVFRTKAECDSCHLPPLFTDGAFHFTGFYNAFDAPPVAPAPDHTDRGRGAITGQEGDRGKHRTPTLRNVALREAGGLLHNGGGLGATLAQVLQAYSTGGLRMDAKIASHIPATVENIKLNKQEIADLTDFLVEGLTDPRVAQELPPFDRPALLNE